MNSQIKIHLRDIAAACGVNVSTVSRALRNAPGVGPELREQIQQTAKEMGYRPNPMVTSLMTQLRSPASRIQSAPLAVLHYDAPSTDSTSFIYFPGVEQRANELGFQVEHFFGSEKGMSDKRLSQILWNRGIRGIILARMPVSTLSLAWDKFCTVSHGHAVLAPNLTRVASSLFDSTVIAMEELIQLGYRRPCLMLGTEMNPMTCRRWMGGYVLMRESLLPDNQLPVIREARDLHSSRLHTIINENKPDVILCAGILDLPKKLERISGDLPHEVGLAHLDLTQAQRDQGLGGIDQHWDAVGAALVDAVVAQMNRNEYGIPSTPKTILIPCSWVQGDSLRAH